MIGGIEVRFKYLFEFPKKMKKNISKIIKNYPSLLSRIYNRLRLILIPFKKIEKYVPEGTVLDVGCGYGLFSIYLALSSKRDVIGSDLDKDRISIAKKASKNINLNNIRFYAKDLMDDMKDLDAIVMIDVLHHLSYKKQEILLKKAIRSLRKGGKIIIKDLETKKGFRYYWNYIHDKIMTMFEIQYFISSDNLVGFLKENGFKIKRKDISNFFYAHYLLICEKE